MDEETYESKESPYMFVSNVKGSDIAWTDSIVDKLREYIVLPLIYPHLIPDREQSNKQHIHLYGAPGNGKTVMLQVFMRRLGVKNMPFFYGHVHDFTSKWHHISINKLFNDVKQNQPCVLMLDELENLEPRADGSLDHVSQRFVDDLLCQFAELENDENSGVLVILSSNSPWRLIPALAEHVTKHIYIPMPDSKVRQQLFQIELDKIPHTLTSTDIRQLASQTDGFTGADVFSLCRSMATVPVREVTTVTHFKKEAKPLQTDRSRILVEYTYTPCSADTPGAVEADWRSITQEEVIIRNITMDDCLACMRTCRPSISSEEVAQFTEFVKTNQEKFSDNSENAYNQYPRSLQYLCRAVLWDVVIFDTLTSLDELPLPKKLKYYLVYGHY